MRDTRLARWLSLLGLIAMANLAGAATQRIEMENNDHSSSNLTDLVTAGIYELSPNTAGIWHLYENPNASGGKAIYLATADTDPAANFKMKIVFVGTGIDLIAEDPGTNETRSGNFTWSLDNGAQTGTGTTTDLAGTPTHQKRLPIVSGLPKVLHTLEIAAAAPDVDHGPNVIRLDAADILDYAPLSRVNDREVTRINYIGGWNYYPGREAGEAFNGEFSYTVEDGKQLSFWFTGTSLVFRGRAGTGTWDFDYNIDNGAKTGTISPEAENPLGLGGDWYRWPILVANDLAPGEHTITLTAKIKHPQLHAVIDGFEYYDPNPPVRAEFENANHASSNPLDLIASNNAGSGNIFEGPELSGGGAIYMANDANNFGAFKCKISFCGTGITLLALDPGSTEPEGRTGNFTWSLDEGAQTGSGTTTDLAGPYTNGKRIPIVSGLPRTMHTLEIVTAAPTQNAAVNVVRLDAADILDPAPITRINDRQTDILSYSAGWGVWDGPEAATAYDGQFTYTTAGGETVDLTFDGTAIVFRGRAVVGTWNLDYDIDNGAYTGTLDLSAPTTAFEFYRWPMLIKNNLPAGQHTIRLTSVTGMDGMQALVDAFEIFGSASEPPNRAQFWTQFE